VQVVRKTKEGAPLDLLASAVVTRPGPFVVELTTQSPGSGSLLIANRFLLGESLTNNFEITRAGWLEHVAPRSGQVAAVDEDDRFRR